MAAFDQSLLFDIANQAPAEISIDDDLFHVSEAAGVLPVSTTAGTAVVTSADPTAHLFTPSTWAPYQGTPPYTTTEPAEYFAPPWDIVDPLAQQQPPSFPIQQASPHVSPNSAYPSSIPFANPPQPKRTLSQQLQQQPVPHQVYTGLAQAHQQKLRAVSMSTGASMQFASPKSPPTPISTSSVSSKKPTSESPEPDDESRPHTGSRKRKHTSSVKAEDDDEDSDGNQPPKKSAHNMIEKRYRTNLNDKIAALRDSVPSLRIMSKSQRGEDVTGERAELDGLTPAHKLNKATVLSKATEYIHHLEKRNSLLAEEKMSMQAKILHYEKLFASGSLGGIPPLQQTPSPVQFQPSEGPPIVATPVPPLNRSVSKSRVQVPPDEVAKRMVGTVVPVRQYRGPQQRPPPPPPPPQHPQQFPPNAALVRQQQVMQQQQMEAQRWPGNFATNGGKAMLGSLAAIMLLEAVRETEGNSAETDGRGLFAMPFGILRSFASSVDINVAGHHIPAAKVLSSLRIFFFLGTLVWAFFPSLFRPRQQSPGLKAAVASSELQTPPSLASPIHVRRDAWLTAIQTVWVPEHNFVLEAAALMLKTVKLSIRNAIGVRGYQLLTGFTEEQEAARVKAWTIALDAQLTGGDVEINRSRLALTFLASRTLPVTPLRLMLKALHIRVLLWELGHDGIHFDMVNMLAAKLARSSWNEARQLHRMMTQLRRGRQQAVSEGIAAPSSDSQATVAADEEEFELPEHLATLLEQPCDEVLTEEIVQRAHNLAWNLPTAHNTDGAARDAMNLVVDDSAVRSPMDGVSAWWSTWVLDRALSTAISSSDSSEEVEKDLEMALRTAPEGSAAQTRALAAKAILVDEGREAAIRAVRSNLSVGASPLSSSAAASPPSSPDSAPALVSWSLPSDAKVAVDCAVAINHLSRRARGGKNGRSSELVRPASPLRIAQDILAPSGPGGPPLSILGYAAAFTLMTKLFEWRSAAVSRRQEAPEGTSDSGDGDQRRESSEAGNEDVIGSDDHPESRTERDLAIGARYDLILERLAGALRVWIGGASGDRCGMDAEVRQAVVERCLEVTRATVGMGSYGGDCDTGYGSMSDDE